MINIKNQDFIHAAKALIAVLITLALIHSFAGVTAIYFALYTTACCALMQAGDTKGKQLISMLLAGAVFLFFLSFGLFIRNHHVLANIALLLFAFVTFYLPNLGLTYKIPPVLALVFYVFVISMSIAPSPFILNVAASAIGVGVAIIVYFLFWPYDMKHELMLLAQTLTHQYRNILDRYVLISRSNNRLIKEAQFTAIAEDLKSASQMLGGYEKLGETNTLKKEELQFFDVIYLRLYSMAQINKMVSEHFPSLSKDEIPLAQQLLKDLITKLKAIEYRFDRMVPHSFLAKSLIGRSLNLGKMLTRPILQMTRGPRKPLLSENEFNTLLEKLISANHANKAFAFGLLRMRELLNNLYEHQEDIHFEVKHGLLFL